MSDPLYRISWVSVNGLTGHGEYCLTRDIAQEWVDTLNKNYPDMTHNIQAF